VDSGSRDATLAIAARAGKVRVVQRAFDNHAAQWNFAVHETGIESEWVLVLDADHVPEERMVEELQRLEPPREVTAYRARFVYCVNGRALRASLYPPHPVLFRRAQGRFVQQGHTQRLSIPGVVADLSGAMRHDDRKPMSRWLRSQWRYAELEAALLEASTWSQLSWAGRARTLLLPAMPAALVSCLLVRGGVRDGWAGIHYALQRTVAEGLIALALIRRRLGVHEETDTP
jgi:hypothetical protein